MGRIFYPFFALLPRKSTLKKKKKKKMKEKDRDIAIIHLCTTNDDHDLWFLSYGVQKNEFSSFWTIFCFYSNNNQENQNSE